MFFDLLPSRSGLTTLCIHVCLVTFILSTDTDHSPVTEEVTAPLILRSNETTTSKISANQTSDPNAAQLRNVQAILYNVAALATGIVGTIGNLLSVCVMLRRSMRQRPVATYLGALAVADTICLWWDPAKGLDTGIRLTPLTHNCNTRHFVNFAIVTFSGSLILAISVERFIALYFPLKPALMSTVCRARIIVVALAFACAVIYSPILVGFDSSCNLTEQALPFMSNLFVVFAITYQLVPSITLIILNTAIIIKLKAIRKEEADLTTITRMVLILSFAFLILTAPYTIFQNYLKYGRGKRAFEGYSPMERLIDEICSRFMFINNAINFFLYVCSSQLFRRELTNMMCCRNAVTPRTTRKSKTLYSIANSDEATQAL